MYSSFHTHVCLIERQTMDREGIMKSDEERDFVRRMVIYHFMGASTFSEYTVVHEVAWPW